MDVLKRSEFCGVSKVKKDVSGVVFVKDIEQGTIFTGVVCSYTRPSTWMRTNTGIVRISNDGAMGTGWHTNKVGYDSSLTISDYKVLNATLVIDD